MEKSLTSFEMATHTRIAKEERTGQPERVQLALARINDGDWLVVDEGGLSQLLKLLAKEDIRDNRLAIEAIARDILQDAESIGEGVNDL